MCLPIVRDPCLGHNMMKAVMQEGPVRKCVSVQMLVFVVNDEIV